MENETLIQGDIPAGGLWPGDLSGKTRKVEVGTGQAPRSESLSISRQSDPVPEAPLFLSRRLPVFFMAVVPLMLVGCSEYSFKDQSTGELGADTGFHTQDTDTDTDIVEEDTASVQGRVCDLTGEGYVAGAYVYIILDTNGDGVEDDRIEATTDSDGYFTLTGVPLGTHTIYVEKGSFSTTFEVTLSEEGNLELAEEECLQDEDVEIAVITGAYDSIEDILDLMEIEYTLYNGVAGQAAVTLLRDPDAMAEYDIIFFNCGIASNWSTHKTEIAANILEFVQNGGSIYTSDWAYYFFEATWPNAVDFYGDDATEGSAYVGESTTLTAQVVDENMQALLASETALLNYDLWSWVVPTSANSNVDVLLTGDAPVGYGTPVTDAPLAVRIQPGGTAIYTTFHNESQITVDMTILLAEIILSL